MAGKSGGGRYSGVGFLYIAQYYQPFSVKCVREVLPGILCSDGVRLPVHLGNAVVGQTAPVPQDRGRLGIT